MQTSRATGVIMNVTLIRTNPFIRWGLIIASAVLLCGVLFPDFVRGLLRADQFMPHATCYLRNPSIIFLHVTSDLLIGLSYVSISTTLAFLVHKASKDIPFHWMFLAFGLFIITCGFTHFMEVWTVWQAVYWLAGYVKGDLCSGLRGNGDCLVPAGVKSFCFDSCGEGF